MTEHRDQPYSDRPPATARTTDLALVATFAALMAVFALVSIPLPGGVPITLQTLAVCLTALIIGPTRAFAATVVYLAVGLAGLPVFANGHAGPGVLAGASAGYLLSFPVYALLVGTLATAAVRRNFLVSPAWLFVSGLAGSLVVVHPMGIAGLMLNAHLSMAKAIAIDVVFLPGDLVKTLVAALVAASVHKAFPRLVARRRVATV